MAHATSKTMSQEKGSAVRNTLRRSHYRYNAASFGCNNIATYITERSNMKNLFFVNPITELRCPHEVTNLAGRTCCDIYGKLDCKTCKYLSGTFRWGVRGDCGQLIVLQQPPIKSSLGWLYGYPTKITKEEPINLSFRCQGTSSDGWRRYRGLR